MNFFYRIRKSKRSYFLCFKIESSGFSDSFSVSLDNYLSTHDLHSTGLDFYGFFSSARTSGFCSVDSFSNWMPFNFSDSKNYFYIEFPTNFGYISPRGRFLRVGAFHLHAVFYFKDFYNSFVNRANLIF